MGDRKLRKSDTTAIGLDIVTKGWQNAGEYSAILVTIFVTKFENILLVLPGVRDEIYIQLCRQTTGTPREEALEKGLELLAMCLSFFPPSNKFHSYLEGYICTHLDMPDVKGNLSY